MPRRLIVCLTVAAGAIPVVAQQATFSSRVEVVRVDVLVTDHGKPLLGLQPTDFEIFDNGILQHVDLMNFEQLPLNVTLALDMSASVIGPRLDHLRGAGRALLGSLVDHDRAALITFSHMVTLGAGLTTNLGSVRAALDQPPTPGNTALVDGTYAGMMVGAAEVGRSLLIVFSDGVDTASWLSADDVLTSAKRSDVVVYGVSSGDARRQTFLRDLTAATGGALFEIESTKDLNAVFLRMLNEFRQRYLVSYSPRGVSKDGWHKLDVRIRGKRVNVTARPGYLAGS